MDPLDIHGSIHGFMDVDVPLGSMDVDVTNIHGYPSSAFTGVVTGMLSADRTSEQIPHMRLAL
jgi:hypothetical protein